MADTETLADKARKIGEDVAAAWNKIQEKGGVLPHTLNTSSLQDVIGQVYNINKWGANGVFLYNYTGAYADFYTKTEVLEMTELPPLPEGATGWPKTLAQLKADIAVNDYVVMLANGDYSEDITFDLNLTNSSYLSPTIHFYVNGNPQDVVIRWGDGSADLIEEEGLVSKQHTYSSVGEYTVTVSVSGTSTTLVVGHTPDSSRYYSILADTNSTGEAAYRSYANNVYLGEKVSIGPGALMLGYRTGTGSWNYSTLSNFAIENYPSVIPDYAFQGIASTIYIVPDHVTSFGVSSFAKCHYLKEFRIPSSVTSLPTNCLSDCDALETVIGLDNITSVGYRALSGCYELNLDASDFDNMTSIGEAAFNNVGYSLPEAEKGQVDFVVRSDDNGIDKRAFVHLQLLKSFDASNASKNYDMIGCAYLKEYKFYGNTTDANFPSFSGCQSLGSISVPEGITTLNSDAFSGATFRKSAIGTTLTLPQTLTTIKSSAFAAAGNKNMTLTIPSGVTTIESAAMNSATFLKVVFEGQMPNLTGDYAVSCGRDGSSSDTYTVDLSNCTSIPTLQKTTSFDVFPHTTVILPDDLYDDWIVSPVWSSLTCHYVKASEV